MRILYLNPSGQLGGAETSLLHLMASLRATEPRWDLRLITPFDGPLPTRAKQLGVSTTTLPMPSMLARLGDSGTGGRVTLAARLVAATPATLRYSAALRRAIGDIAPDLIHTNGFKMHILGIRACPAGIPVVWHLHDYVSPRPAMSFLMRRHARDPAAIIANSESVAADFAQATGRTAHAFYNGIDIDHFSPPPVVTPGPPRQEAIAPRIGMVATFARWKGHDVFLRALSLLPRDLHYRASIDGGPIYETGGSQYSLDELRQLGMELGVADKVTFTGFLEDPAAAMRALDIVVHCSVRPEPFGMAIAEAMACGRAVIASNSGGAAEIISPGVDALAHPAGDAAALACCIEQLAGDATLRAALGAAARATALQRFDRRRLGPEIRAIYQRFRK